MSAESGWTALMRRARAGDGAAYDRCLRELAHALRPVVRRGLARAGKSLADTEDVVQDILIAVHLKRHTWDAGRPFEPWLYAIARHKLTDALRKRGSRVEVPIELFAETLPSEGEIEPRMAEDVTRSLEGLPRRQADVVRAIAIDGVSIAETAARLDISEGAVRVALHRGLAALTRRNRDDG